MHTQRWKDGMWSSFASRWHSIDNSSPISINKTCSSSSYLQIHRTFWTKGKAGIKLRTRVAEIRGVQLRTSRSWPAHLTCIISFQTKHSYTDHSFIKRKKKLSGNVRVFFKLFTHKRACQHIHVRSFQVRIQKAQQKVSLWHRVTLHFVTQSGVTACEVTDDTEVTWGPMHVLTCKIHRIHGPVPSGATLSVSDHQGTALQLHVWSLFCQ